MPQLQTVFPLSSKIYNTLGHPRNVSESRQSSTEEVAHELFHNIEQFTKQAKRAAESFEIVVEAGKTKAIAKVCGTISILFAVIPGLCRAS
jgi:hypothetical protein